MSTIALAGYSTTREITAEIASLMGNYTIWEPTDVNWGLSSFFLSDVVVEIAAINPDPVLIWVAVGGPYEFARTPDSDSPYTDTLANYKSNITAGLNYLIAETSTPCIVVANCVPIGAAQGVSAPYRFESDAVIFRAALSEAVAAIGNNRLIYYDHNQLYIDNNIVQPDGIHADAAGEIIVSGELVKYFGEVLGVRGMSDGIINLESTDKIIAPTLWGEGNGTVNKNTGYVPTYLGNFNAILTSMGVGYGYIYQSDSSYVSYEDGDHVSQDHILTDIKFTITNTNSFGFGLWVTVADAGVNRSLFGLIDDAQNYLKCRITSGNVLIWEVEVGDTRRRTDSTTTVSNGLKFFYFKKIGAKMYMFINGVQVTYNNQPNYAEGDKTFSSDLRVGNYDDGVLRAGNNLHWFRYKDTPLSNAEILSQYNKGLSMGGAIGEDDGAGVMTISIPGGKQYFFFNK